MNSIRYIITRSCLQDGSMRLLKYNEGHFSQGGPAQFVDDRGTEHHVHVDREHMRVTGLRTFYHDLNLGVNDVMMITPLAPGRYQVEVIVKPHPIQTAPRPVPAPTPEARRVVVSSTPHVREVRLQHSVPSSQAAPQSPPQEGQPDVSQAVKADALREVAALYQNRPEHNQAPQNQAVPTPSAQHQPAQHQLAQHQLAQHQLAPARSERSETERHRAAAEPQRAAPRTEPAPRREAPPLQAADPSSTSHSVTSNPVTAHPGQGYRSEDQVAEFAALTGYRLEYPATGLMRLSADLGPQYGYSVLLATDPLAMTQPAWEEARDEAKLLLTHEGEKSEGLPRLTREALGTLIDHAHLAPLSPVDLRGYWRAGSIDLEGAASITELVSAHLAQRGTFTFVLLSLAQQGANSIVSVSRLAERLGSGVNTAELSTILETLARPPFLALTPLPGGQYLLRTDVSGLLGELADYAQGVRRRTGTAENAAVTAAVPLSKVHA